MKMISATNLLGLAAIAGTADVLCAGTLYKIALDGEAVPGGNGVFAPGFSAPAINNHGLVIFRAGVDQSSPVSLHGVFCGTPGALAQVARGGQVPGALSGSEFASTGFFFGGAINDSAEIAFGAPVSPGVNQRAVLKKGRSRSSYTLSARTGTASPVEGVLAPSALHSAPALSSQGTTAFYADLTGTNGATTDDSAIVRGNANGTLTMIAQEGAAVPGGSGTLVPYTETPALANSGAVAFLAEIAGEAVSDQSAIVRGSGSALTLISRSGNMIVGTGTIVNFGSAAEVAINATGHVAFPFSVTGTNVTAIAVGNGTGTLSVEARVGDAILNYPGQFLDFDPHVALNDAGQVAYVGLILANNQAVAGAVFRGRSVMAVTGQSLPGGGGTFSGFGGNEFAMNATGQLAFVGNVSTGGKGLFFHNGGSVLELVAREGMPWLGGTLAEIDFAGTSAAAGGGVLAAGRNGLNNAGEVTFRFKLTDGREGIALWSKLPKQSATGSGSIARQGAGYRVRFAGIPGWDYLIQRDVDLDFQLPSVQIISPIRASNDGWITHDDLGPGLPVRRFYRATEAP